MTRVAAILLAAGRGARFGDDSKLLADLAGRPVLDHAAAALEAAGIVPRAAVIRPGDDAVRAVVEARGFTVVENPRWELGMGTSIAAGAAWAEARDADAVLIALGDAPFVTASLLRQLTDLFSNLALVALNAPVVAAFRETHPASPAVFGRPQFAALAGLEGDEGARSVVAANLDALAGVPAAPGELDDVDTPEALDAARARMEIPLLREEERGGGEEASSRAGATRPVSKRTRLARRLRQEVTPAENTLWGLLRNRKLDGLKFRRQHPVAGFVADFACPEATLIVELDGGIHDRLEARDRDQDRTRRLQAAGWRVIRFKNADVLNDLASVRDEIQRVAKSRLRR
jgi:CTP:molybdopterin cytidylyltransferase MocA/very-short-patch-repair endonuclease